MSEDDTLPSPVQEAKRQALVVVGREHYELLGELARGGLGRIVRARDLRTGRVVAIKEMLRSGGEARFEFEAILSANLQHPATVPVYEVGRWPTGEPFYAMKLVAGRSLEAAIAAAADLRARIALVPHIIAVAEALAYAHAERVIHRDLKPANVLVGDYGETVVIDWGLAKNLRTGDEGGAPAGPIAAARPGETVAGTVVGTPSYMAPEQARGEPVDERTDVYAIGAMLYHVLGGQRPYHDSATPDEVIDRVALGPPRRLAEVDPDIPGELAAIVAKAMAARAADRYPAASFLAEDLKRFTTGQLVSAHRYTAWQRVRRWVGRHRAAVTASAVAVVALAALAGYSVRRIVAERDAAEEQRRDAVAQRREAELRLGELFVEQGRQLLVGGDAARALVYLAEGMRRGAADKATRFLAGQALAELEPLEAVLGGHSQGARNVDFSPDGERLVSSGIEGRVALWDVPRRRLIAAVTGGQLARYAGDAVVSLALAGPITVWDARTLAPRGVVFLPGRDHPVVLAVSDDGKVFAAAGFGGSAAWWRTDTLAPIATIAGGGKLTALDIRPDGGMVAGAREGGRIELWSRDGSPAATLAGHDGYVNRLAFSPDGAWLASAGDDKTAILWDARTGAVHARLTGHTGAVVSLAFAPSGALLATGSADKTAIVWDVAGGSRRAQLVGHSSNVNAIRFTPDGKGIATAGEEGTARLWTVDGAPERSFAGTTLTLQDLAVSADGRRLATAGYDGRVRVWRLDAPPRLLPLDVTPPIQDADFSPDGAHLAIAGRDGQVAIVDGHGGGPVLALPRGATARSVAYAPDGARLVTAGRDGELRVWDAATGAPVLHVRAHEGEATRAAFDRRGERIVSVGEDVTARVWGARDGAVLQRLGPLAGPGLNALFSPDGTRIVTTTDASTADLWDAATGARVASLTFQERRVRALAFSPDGALFAVGAFMAPPVVYRSTDGAEQARLVGHAPFPITEVDFAPDGGRLVSASADGTARVWDARAGAQLALLEQIEGPITAARWSPDGARIATASLDDTVRIWDVASGRLLAAVGERGQPYGLRWSPDGTRLAILPLKAAPVLWRVGGFGGGAEELARIVHCYVPFQVVGAGLAPATPESADCAR